MSRGFVKEDDQEDVPLVTPRAHLPIGVQNYVTPNGLEELQKEQQLLIKERTLLKEQSSDDNRVQINHITAKLRLLEERIHSAKLIHLENQPQEEVHFGALITLSEENAEPSQYQIVGVDEANVSLNKISFLSPLAKVLMHKRVGETILLKTPKGNRTLKIMQVQYPS